LNNYNSLPPLFRPANGVSHGQDYRPPDKGGVVPATSAESNADAEIQHGADCVENRIPDLDSRAVCLHFGVPLPPHPRICTTEVANEILARAMRSGRITPKDVTRLHHEVWAAVCALEWEIASGTLKREPRLVRGQPLGDWLSLDDVARILREVQL
jgi:hypothetical protein